MVGPNGTLKAISSVIVAVKFVAERGSAFLCAGLEPTLEGGDDQASYIASWIKVLKDDKRAIFSAASHAQRAADFLHGLQPRAAADAA